MKKVYVIILGIIFYAGFASAVDQVNVSPGTGTLQAAIDAVAANGDEAVSNTEFVLQRDGEYIVEASISNETYSLTIIAAEGNGARPVIKSNGAKQRPFTPKNSITLKGLRIEGVYEGVESQSAIIRAQAGCLELNIDDCHLDNNYNSGIRIDDAATVTITNSIISNIISENSPNAGMGIQDKASGPINLVVKNTTFYNIGREVFFDAGGSPKASVEFDHCTMVNVGGTCLGLVQTVISKITNNLFINVGFFGSGVKTDTVFAISLDTLGFLVPPEYTQEAVITNNNFYIEPELLSALPDTFNAVVNLNQVAEPFADESTFLNEKISFDTPLPSVLPLMEYLTNPEFVGDFDRTAVPYFAYDNTHASRTADTEGAALGDHNWLNNSTGIFKSAVGNNIEIKCYPNPVEDRTTVSFYSKDSGFMTLEVIDITGSVVKSIYSGILIYGENSFDLKADGLAVGLYFIRLSVNGNSSVQKIIVR